jgi:hypothetical protein
LSTVMYKSDTTAKRCVCGAHSPAAQLYICTDAGCTAVRVVDPSGVYICTEQGSSHLYSWVSFLCQGW